MACVTGILVPRIKITLIQPCHSIVMILTMSNASACKKNTITEKEWEQLHRKSECFHSFLGTMTHVGISQKLGKNMYVRA